MWVYVWALIYSVPLTYALVSVAVPYCFDDYSLVVLFEIREHDTSRFVILSQECVLINWGLLWVQTNFKIISCTSMKNVIGILIEIVLNL